MLCLLLLQLSRQQLQHRAAKSSSVLPQLLLPNRTYHLNLLQARPAFSLLKTRAERILNLLKN